jgi:myo-inositol 2-dehydrogenase / D-chiro-inositol 1-dehydrogenase
MKKAQKVKVGFVGSQFISTIHADSVKRVPEAELFAVLSPSGDHAKTFAQKNGVAHAFKDLDGFLASEIDMVVLGCPNDLHADITVRAAAAGKHVVCEKPLAPSLAEADRMIEACRKAKVKLMYAEELCFTPKYVRMKKLLDEGALGRPYLIKQTEKHDGPHSPWFWDVDRSGGGVAFDMGCHAVEFFRWMLGKAPGQRPWGGKGVQDQQSQSHPSPLSDDIVPLKKPRALSVQADLATYVHGDKTHGDDNATILVRFETDEGEALGIAEESWTKKGGMDDRAEVHGVDGVAYADLMQGNAITTYSEKGYGYAVEKAGITRGWSFCTFEELWNYGFPQEFAHFVDCVANDKQPLETGEDGRAVLEILMAAYASAGTGKRITLPFQTDARRPIDLWKPDRGPKPGL